MKKRIDSRSSPKVGTIDHKKAPPKRNEVAKGVRGESISKITERVLKEHRPALDWLAGK